MKNISLFPSGSASRLAFCGSIAALMLVVASPANAVYTPPASGLIGWWSGDGNALDSSGHGHDGTLQGGMGFTTGVFGQAFASDSNKRVFIPDSPEFQLTNSMTV